MHRPRLARSPTRGARRGSAPGGWDGRSSRVRTAAARRTGWRGRTTRASDGDASACRPGAGGRSRDRGTPPPQGGHGLTRPSGALVPAASHHAVRCCTRRAGRARHRSIVDVIVSLPQHRPRCPYGPHPWVDSRRVAPTPDLPPYRPGFADLAPFHDCEMTRIGEGRRSGGRASSFLRLRGAFGPNPGPRRRSWRLVSRSTAGGGLASR